MELQYDPVQWCVSFNFHPLFCSLYGYWYTDRYSCGYIDTDIDS